MPKLANYRLLGKSGLAHLAVDRVIGEHKVHDIRAEK